MLSVSSYVSYHSPCHIVDLWVNVITLEPIVEEGLIHKMPVALIVKPGLLDLVSESCTLHKRVVLFESSEHLNSSS